MIPAENISGLMLSILAHDRTTGALGIALASSSIAIGSRCPSLAPGKAVVTSQGFTNLKVGPLALDLVACGLTAHEAMAALRQHDRWIEFRQIAIVTASGAVAAHTGTDTKGWSGHELGPELACLANGLPDPSPLSAMHARFAATPGSTLAERLLSALEHGCRAVGRRRPVASAALLVRAPAGDTPLDLRVDLTDDAGRGAVEDLRRLYGAFLPLTEVYDRRSRAPQPIEAHP